MNDSYRSAGSGPFDCEVNAIVVDLGIPPLLFPCRVTAQGEDLVVKVAARKSRPHEPYCLGRLSPALLEAERGRWGGSSGRPIAIVVLYDSSCAVTLMQDTPEVRHHTVVGEAGFCSPASVLVGSPEGTVATVLGLEAKVRRPDEPLTFEGLPCAIVAQSRSGRGIGVFERGAGAEGITCFDGAGPVPRFPAA